MLNDLFLPRSGSFSIRLTAIEICDEGEADARVTFALQMKDPDTMGIRAAKPLSICVESEIVATDSPHPDYRDHATRAAAKLAAELKTVVKQLEELSGE